MTEIIGVVVKRNVVGLILCTIMLSGAVNADQELVSSWQNEISKHEILRRSGNEGEALEHAKGLVSFARQHFSPDSAQMGDALHCLALSYNDRGRPRAADGPIQRAIALRAAHYGKKSSEYIRTLLVLANNQMQNNNYTESTRSYRAALVLAENSYGPDSYEVGSILTRLAMLDCKAARFKEAEKKLSRCVRLLGDPCSDNARDYCVTNSILGHVKLMRGLPYQADTLVRAALEIADKHLRPDDDAKSLCLTSLALVEWEKGRKKKAILLQEESVNVARASYGEIHPAYANSLYILSGMYYKQLMGEETVRTLLNTMQVLKNLEEESPDLTIEVLDLLSAVYMESNHPDLAMPVLAELIVSLREHRGPLDASLREPTENIIKVLKQLEKTEDVALFEKYLRMLETPDAVPEDRTPKPGDSILRSVLAFQ